MAEETPLGIYSTERATYVGAGMARRKNVQKRYWSVWDGGEDRILVQPLNQNLAPTGDRRVIGRQEFEERFTHEPDFYSHSQKSSRPIAVDYTPDARTNSPAEPEAAPLTLGREVPRSTPEKRVILDYEEDGAVPEEPKPKPETIEEVEDQARADFGLALTYLHSGKPSRARKMFAELAAMRGKFEVRHKHMFNEFGINLRKSRILDLALDHYNRALELSPEDENIYHNIARLYYERDEWEKSEQFLLKSLKINPNLRESQQFLRFLRRKHGARKGLKFDI